jgi:hypothetical protein
LPEVDQNLRKIARFLHMVQVQGYIFNYFHIYLVAKVWLNIPVNHRHFGFNTKLSKKPLPCTHHGVIILLYNFSCFLIPGELSDAATWYAWPARIR